MTKKNSRKEQLYLEDMVMAIIDKVLNYTKNLDFVRFEKDELIKDAVLLNLQIVGEAANKIGVKTRQSHPEIPWKDMANFRIIVAHIYFSVNFEQVWDLVIYHLPQNLVDLKRILGLMKQ